MIKILAEYYHINIKEGPKLETPLCYACAHHCNYTDIIKYLIENGAWCDVYNTDHMTPLHYAALRDTIVLHGIIYHYKYIDTAINCTDADGWTLLHYICREFPQSLTIKKLIKCGANYKQKTTRKKVFVEEEESSLVATPYNITTEYPAFSTPLDILQRSRCYKSEIVISLLSGHNIKELLEEAKQEKYMMLQEEYVATLNSSLSTNSWLIVNFRSAPSDILALQRH